MKWHNCPKISLALAAFLGALVVSAGPAKADFTWGTPTNLGPSVNSPSLDGAACISPDGLTLYFASDRTGGLGYEDIWVTTRSAVSELWGPPVNLGPPVNSQFREIYPSISADGLELYFSDSWTGPQCRPGGIGSRDLWRTERQSLGDPWALPVNLGAIVNSTADEWGPVVSYDGRTLVFASNRILYVDDREVARDTQATLTGTYAGLHVGAGCTLAPGAFWSGLIDDVRIYDRVVRP